jgi:hypothetical protein
VKPLNFEKLVGKKEGTALKKVEAAGFLFRVVERDGESLIVTQDVVNNRANFAVDDGKIVSFKGIY